MTDENQNTITTVTSTMNGQDYNASQIKVLEWLEPVRQRPWMYIWSTDIKGLHHMIQEIVDNAVDESLAWYCNNITVILHPDNSVTVHDNWRWIPVDKHEKTWKSALETVFTVLHAWWKFDKWAYKISWWLHWVWASVVNALSDRLVAEVHKNWKIYRLNFEKWITQWDIEIVWETNKNWTSITFMPDATVFETIQFNEVIEVARMRQSAYLTPWVTFTLINEITWLKRRFYFEWWIKTWLINQIWEQEKIWQQFYISQEWKNCLVEATFQFTNTENDNVSSYVNNIPTIDWWTHVLWFKSALLNVMNELATEKWKINKKIWEFQYMDILNWLYSIVTVKIPEPQFEWQTKWKLWNSYVRNEVEKVVTEYLRNFFVNNEEEFNKIFEKVELAARARLAAKFAKETILRKNVLLWWVLPWKLADCRQKKAEWTEMYIVEGDSAWGSAKQWRNSDFQAILPLRWKILNTEQAHIQRIMANTEVKALITAIGTWIKESFDIKTLRYEKIIIMTDADVDWAHIRTLLLTFFFRFMRPLIEEWHLFIACPPIYKIKQWKNEKYAYPPIDDIEDAVKQLGMNPNENYEAQRYKGLWEMNPEQLWETTMNPENRRLNKITVDDAEEADKLFRILMGEDVVSRKHFILTHAKSVKDLDI